MDFGAAFLNDYGIMYAAISLAYFLHAILELNGVHSRLNSAQRKRMHIALLVALGVLHGLQTGLHIADHTQGASNPSVQSINKDILYA